MYCILEYADGPALCVGYRSLAAAEAALKRLRSDDDRYAGHVVAVSHDPVSPAG